MTRQDAERRLRFFERDHGTALVQLASHAALPVVLNPDFVHLLRVNYFLDPPSTLPYAAEAELLLSQLCTEVDHGLYVIETELRDVLLRHLIEGYGTARLHDVARLLWEYGQRSTPWLERPGLTEAQQLTALNFIDPGRARDWLDRAELSAEAGTTVDDRWFVAMRRDLEGRTAALERLEEVTHPRLDPLTARVTLVRFVTPDGTPSAASGLLIDDRRVLTTDHVANGSGHSVESSIGRHDVVMVLRSHTPEVDIAVLELADPVPGPSPAKYAQVNQSRADRVLGCRAIGFPQRMKDAKQLSATVSGSMPTVEGLTSTADSGLPAGPLTLICDGVTLGSSEEGAFNGLSPDLWAGMSGAAVVAGDLVIGVISSHNIAADDSSFGVTPVTAIERLPDGIRQQFWDALGVADPRQFPVIPNAPAAKTSSELLISLTEECTVKIGDVDSIRGSGFFVAPGTVATCAFVVAPSAGGAIGAAVTVEWKGRRLTGRLRTASRQGRRNDSGLSIIKLDEPLQEHPWVLLGDVDTSKSAELHLAGYAYIYDSTAGHLQGTRARLEGTVGSDDTPEWQIADGEIAFGMAGGPVLQVHSGLVCGVTKAARIGGNTLGGLMISAVAIRDAFPDVWHLNQQTDGQNPRWLTLRSALLEPPEKALEVGQAIQVPDVAHLDPQTAGGRDEVDNLVEAWRALRPDLDVEPFQVLSRISRFARHLDIARRGAFAGHDLESWEFDVLSALRRQGAPFQLTPGALIRTTLVTSGTMTNRIDRLAAAGLVNREPDPSDKRGVLVTLTEQGKQRVDAALADLLQRERALLAGLDIADREQLADLLRTLLASFSASDGINVGAYPPVASTRPQKETLVTPPVDPNPTITCPICLHYLNWDQLPLYRWDNKYVQYQPLVIPVGASPMERARLEQGAFVRCPNASPGEHYLPAGYGQFGPPIVVGFIGLTKSGKTHLLAAMVDAIERGALKAYGIETRPVDPLLHSKFLREQVRPLMVDSRVLPGTPEGTSGLSDAFVCTSAYGPARVVAFFDVAGGELARLDDAKPFLWISDGFIFVVDPDYIDRSIDGDITFENTLDIANESGRLSRAGAVVVLTKADTLPPGNPLSWRLSIPIPGLDVELIRHENDAVQSYLEASGMHAWIRPYKEFSKATMHVASATGRPSDGEAFIQEVKPRRVLGPLLAILAMTGILGDEEAQVVGKQKSSV